MRGGRRLGVAIVLGGVVVLVAIGAGLLAIPAVSAPTAGKAPSLPLIVTIGRPGPGGPAYRGYPVVLTAHALGAATVTRLELWAGSERIEAADLDGTAPAAAARWSWSPTTTGQAILVGRAVDRYGRTAQSNVIRLTVLDQLPPQLELREVSADGATTLAALIEAEGGDPTLAARYNAPLEATAMPPAGTTVTVPIVSQLPAPPPSARAAPPMALVADVAGPLAVPAVQASLDGCSLTLKVSDSATAATGLAVYASGPSSSGFSRLKTLPPKPGGSQTFKTQVGAGSYLFSASAFDTLAEAQSTPIVVDVPDSCAGDGWTGAASLQAGVLHVAKAVDRAYIYLSIDKGAWQRIPADPQLFIEPTAGVLDAGLYLPASTGKRLSIHAWGWSGGGLLDLGSGDYDPKLDANASLALGLGTLTHLEGITKHVVIKDVVAVDPKVTPDPGLSSSDELVTPYQVNTIDRPTEGHSNFNMPIKREFHWQTKAAGIDHLIWQILSYPPASQPILDPPFLVDAGCVPVPDGQFEGTFSIDFRQYFDHPYDQPSGCVTKGDGLWQQLDATAIVPTGTPPANVDLAKPILPGVPTGPPSAKGPVDGGSSGTSTGVVSILPGGEPLIAVPDHFYVQVLAMKATDPVGGPSNSVRFDVVEPGPDLVINQPDSASYKNAYQLQAWVAIPTAAQPKYSRCVDVVDTPNHGTWSYTVNGFTFGTYKPDQVLCYVPPDDSGWDPFDAFELFVEFVAGVWDYVVQAYDWIQDQVVNLMVVALHCEQIMSKEQCTSLAKTALHAVMVAYGIPPTLPDFKSEIAALKGDLAEYVVDQLGQQFPAVQVACDGAETAKSFDSSAPTCQELVEKAVDKITDEILKTQSDSAAQAAGVFVPPGVTVVPDPRGQWSPPAFRFRLTATGNPPNPSGCSVGVSMQSSLASASWTEVQWLDKDYDQDGVIDATHVQTYVKVQGSASGAPFQPKSIPVPKLQPGQSWPADSSPTDPQTWHGVWLMDPQSPWFESYHAKQYAQWEEGVGADHAWKLLMPGAKLDLLLSGNCNQSAGYSETLSDYAGQ